MSDINNFKDIMQNYSDNLARPFVFMQIGCNDGRLADPISELVIKNSWKGTFFDADIFYIEKAAQYYYGKKPVDHDDDDWKFVHAAVSTFDEKDQYQYRSGLRKFYSIEPIAIRPNVRTTPDGNSFWVYGDWPYLGSVNCGFDDSISNPLDYLQGVGSFDYDFVLNHIANVISKQDVSGEIARNVFTENIDEHKKFIRMQFVPIFNVNQCFEHLNHDYIDLLQTDMELWDVKVLEDIGRFTHKPEFIHFEAPTGPSELLEANLKKCNYRLIKTDRDYLAILDD